MYTLDITFSIHVKLQTNKLKNTNFHIKTGKRTNGYIRTFNRVLKDDSLL